MPAVLVLDVRVALVPVLVSVTVASEITAPLASVIVPVISPVGVWARAAAPHNRKNTADRLTTRAAGHLLRGSIVNLPWFSVLDGCLDYMGGRPRLDFVFC